MADSAGGAEKRKKSGSKRTVIVAVLGVVVLGLAAAWFFYEDELTKIGTEALELVGLAEPPPPKPAAKPAAQPASQPQPANQPGGQPAPATATAAVPAKPAAVAQTTAAVPASPASGVQVAATKPAPPVPAAPASGAAPAAMGPEELLADLVRRSGTGTFGEAIREAALEGMEAHPDREKLAPETAKALRTAVENTLAPDRLNEQFRAKVREDYDASRFTAYIDVLRNPIMEKMVRLETAKHSPDEVRQFMKRFSTLPPSVERRRMIRQLDAITRYSQFGADTALLVPRAMGRMSPDTAGRKRGSPRASERQLEVVGKAMQAQMSTLLFLVYRDASDAELKEYISLIETGSGYWGATQLTGAKRAVIDAASRDLGNRFSEIAQEQRAAERAASVAAPAPASSTPDAAAAAAPVAEAPELPVVPSLPADSPVVYARYNDLISAVTMGDHPSVQELLASGKSPDARASNGYTALMVAVWRGDVAMAQLLLERGANPNLRAATGEGALGLAQRAKHRDLVTLLTRFGARP